MSFMKASVLLLLLCFLVPSRTTAQDKKFKLRKWGDIPTEDLALTRYPLDTSAAAVVLQELGKLEIAILNDYFQVELTTHRRIKVFDVSAFDKGNLEIYYRSKTSEERFSGLDIVVFAPDGTRRTIKSDNIYTEKRNKYISVKKIFIPDLQKGSIIEYRYTLSNRNDLLTPYSWNFQDEIPVRWSQLDIVSPTMLDYVLLTRSSRPFDLHTAEPDTRIGSGMNYPVAEITYAMADMPALKEEPYMTTLDNYRTQIGFQLRTFMPPNGTEKKYLESWNTIAKNLLEDGEFGLQYARDARSHDCWKLFSASLEAGESPAGIAQKALNFVGTRVRWNGEFRRYAKQTPDEALKNGSGSSADINLLLVALLRQAKIQAYPLLISTRSNGRLFTSYPFVDQFNSVLACYKNGDKFEVLDGTSPFHCLNALQTECYNYEGIVVNPDDPVWAPITPPEASTTWFANLVLDEEGTLNGDFALSNSGSYGIRWREMLQDSAGAAKVIKNDIGSAFADFEASEVKIEGLDDNSKPLQVNFKCHIPNAANVVNDFIYFKPVLDFITMENPFKSINRDFPVEFPYPIKANYILNLDIPEGYVVEEMPEQAKITLPENGGKLSFVCSKVSERRLQFILKMNISQLSFSPDQYGVLRQYFDLVASKTQLQLVLKTP
jgi:hypothetical protein